MLGRIRHRVQCPRTRRVGQSGNETIAPTSLGTGEAKPLGLGPRLGIHEAHAYVALYRSTVPIAGRLQVFCTLDWQEST